jgi:hypothetical protein
MSRLQDILWYIGLGTEGTSDEVAIEYSSYKPKAKDLKKLESHRDYLKSIVNEENNRLNSFDTKTTQLVAQTGVIFALLSLFVPLVIDKIEGFYLKIIVLIPLFLAFLFYLRTIQNAAKNFNVKKFKYGKSLPTTVINHRDTTIEEFLIEEIQDLIFSAEKNFQTNNSKANNLIQAYNSFRVANVLAALLGILLCASILFTKPKKERLTIESPIRIESVNSN